MRQYTRRLQVLLDEEQFAQIKEISRRTGRASGELVREALDFAYRPQSNIKARQALHALKKQTYIDSHYAKALSDLLGEESV